MDSARHTEVLMGVNQDITSSFVCPEVLRISRGAEAPAFVALRAPLRYTQRTRTNTIPYGTEASAAG